jgi:hypothetical protein
MADNSEFSVPNYAQNIPAVKRAVDLKMFELYYMNKKTLKKCVTHKSVRY